MKRKFRLIDMRCGECEKEFKVSNELKDKFVERTGKFGRLWFYENKDSLDPNDVPCPNCEHPNPAWYEGKDGKEANEVDGLNIGGNVYGTNIIIGDNNKV